MSKDCGMIKFVLLLPLLIAATGCNSMPKIITALGKDPATVTVRVTTIYGTIYYTRTNPGTNTAPHIIAPDGSVRVER